jgi:hypothetical protein
LLPAIAVALLLLFLNELKDDSSTVGAVDTPGFLLLLLFLCIKMCNLLLF